MDPLEGPNTEVSHGSPILQQSMQYSCFRFFLDRWEAAGSIWYGWTLDFGETRPMGSCWEHIVWVDSRFRRNHASKNHSVESRHQLKTSHNPQCADASLTTSSRAGQKGREGWSSSSALFSSDPFDVPLPKKEEAMQLQK